MAEKKFIHITAIEIKPDSVTGMKLASFGNYLALYGCIPEVHAFELVQEPDSNNLFPYEISQFGVTLEIPTSRLTKRANISRIYANCSVQESQELALEPVYVSECGLETAKPKVHHLDWAPTTLLNQTTMLALLTSYGAFELIFKKGANRDWHFLDCKLHKLFFSEIFPPQQSTSIGDITKYQQFKELIDQYWITAFAWGTSTEENIIYTANAAGYIVALKLSQTAESELEVKQYCRIFTKLGRIIYIKPFDNFILVTNQRGEVYIFKIDHGNAPNVPNIKEIDCLWSQADYMTVQKIEVSLVQDLNAYLVVFTKAAHVLAYRLTLEGKIVCSSTLYVSGINITGIQKFTEKEFIITTLNSVVRLIHISSPTDDQLNISEEIVSTDIDAANMQILGVATTQHRNIWTFLLFRNREYTYLAKNRENTVFLKVCKLNTVDSLTILSNLNINHMNACLDYTVGLRIDMLNNWEPEKYSRFLPLNTTPWPKEMNDTLLQKLQIKLHIIKAATKYQNIKFKAVRKETMSEYDFLLQAIQITHILCRLQYLQKQKLPSKNAQTHLLPFQELSGKCMNVKIQILLKEFIAQADEKNPLKDSIQKFVQQATNALSTYCSREYQSVENCIECEQKVSEKTMMCPSEHRVNRCCVSFVQVPHFNKRYCVACKCQALEDDHALQQLFSPSEIIKCTFCRFLLMKMEI